MIAEAYRDKEEGEYTPGDHELAWIEEQDRDIRWQKQRGFERGTGARGIWSARAFPY